MPSIVTDMIDDEPELAVSHRSLIDSVMKRKLLTSAWCGGRSCTYRLPKGTSSPNTMIRTQAVLGADIIWHLFVLKRVLNLDKAITFSKFVMVIEWLCLQRLSIDH